MRRIVAFASFLIVLATVPASGQSSRNGPYSEVAGSNTPTGWTKLREYPEPCRDKMNQTDGALAGKGALVEKYLLPPQDGSVRRNSIWMIGVDREKMVVIFAWDQGGTLCSMDTADQTSVGKKLGQ